MTRVKSAPMPERAKRHHRHEAMVHRHKHFHVIFATWDHAFAYLSVAKSLHPLTLSLSPVTYTLPRGLIAMPVA
jgi:hypothetical protein